MLYADSRHKTFFLRHRAVAQGSHETEALIYLLGICDTTRNHYSEIYDENTREIDIAQLQKGWQTGTTIKITRLAFNLFSGFIYEDSDDFFKNKISKYYSVDEIFSCGYGPYLYQAIKLRYPEYNTPRGIEGNE